MNTSKLKNSKRHSLGLMMLGPILSVGLEVDHLDKKTFSLEG